MKSKDIAFVINTPSGKNTREDEIKIRTAAILLGYPGTTQDVDGFPAKAVESGQRMVKALLGIGLIVDNNNYVEIIRGKEFFDFIFAPDGIKGFVEA